MNVYLIYSDSYKIIKNEVNKIITNSSNVIKYNLQVDSLKDVINEANYYSLTGEYKYIVVNSKDLFKAKKKDSEEEALSKDGELLEKYLENPSKDSTIIFTSYENPDKRKKVFKKIDSIGNYIEFPPLNKKDLVYKCINILKEKGYYIDYESANYIVENSYVNFDVMTNELEKIYALIKPKSISLEDLKDVVSVSYSSSIHHYINALIDKNLSAATKMQKDFEVLKIDETVVLITLFKEIEMLYLLKSGIDYKIIQTTYKKEPWQMNNYVNNKDKFTINELKKIIIQLSDYDYQVKSGILDKSVLLDLISLDMCE